MYKGDARSNRSPQHLSLRTAHFPPTINNLAELYSSLMFRSIWCFFFWAALCSVGAAQEEESVFSNEDALTAPEARAWADSPTHPATAYWRVTVTMALSKAPPNSHVQM